MVMKKIVLYRKRELGVVLLSCLVFLLILLGIVRFVMTSSRLEERKAGVDYEMMTARHSAQMAIRQAVKYIMDQGLQSCIKSNNISPNAPTSPGSGANQKCEDKNQAELANILWKNSDGDLGTALDKIGQKQVLNKGIYTYAFIANNYSNCRPFWTCINWTGNAKSVAVTGKQLNDKAGASLNKLESIECTECETTSGVKPRFVIERFLASDLKNMDFPDQSLTLKSSDVVVFRITAVGFGNGQGGSNVNTTNAVMQAIYVLNG